MHRYLWIAAALIAAALPASAETWGVSDKPHTADASQPMCMIWYGTQAPMMNLTRMPDRNFITVAAPQFATVEDRAQARLAYPTGRAGTVSLRKDSSAPNVVFVFLPDEVMEAVLDQLRTPGTFTLTSGEASASFPVPGLDSAITHLDACMAQFPDAPSETE